MESAPACSTKVWLSGFSVSPVRNTNRRRTSEFFSASAR